MMMKESMTKLSNCLVACNIYVSAGQPRWKPLLLKLLHDAQHQCSLLRTQHKGDPLAVVHAYADGPYDRSSFHLAGTAPLVAQLASEVACQAVESVITERTKELQKDNAEGNTPTPHPTVGVVDHVSILPLSTESTTLANLSLEQWQEALAHKDGFPYRFEEDSIPQMPTTPTGWVARTVGMSLKSRQGVQVYWYGYAHPDKTPLATVRRESTAFFRSLPPTHDNAQASVGQATVGAPPHFVENYNIQVRTSEKLLAQSLTKWVRTREGGLPEVEALTLAYGNEATPLYEVACNLLNPEITSTEDIDSRVQAWPHAHLVEHSYRVGTTVETCLDALQKTSHSSSQEELYNTQVQDRLSRNLSRD